MQIRAAWLDRVPVVDYSLAVVLTVIVVVLRLALSPFLENVAALTLFIVPVIISSWYGGLGPGLLAIALCVLASNYFLFEPYFSLTTTHRSDQIRLGLFIFEALPIIGLIELLHRSRLAAAQAEQTIRKSEEHLRNILDSLFALVGVLTPDTRVVQGNRAALNAIGMNMQEVIGCPFADLQCWSYDPVVKARLEAAMMEAARGNLVRYDVDIQVADGSLRTIDFTLAPMWDAAGRVSHLIPSGIDITERTRAEARLARNEAQLAAIIDSAMDAIITIDAEHHIVVFNVAAEQMFGYTQDAIIGESISRLLPEAVPVPIMTFEPTQAPQCSMQSLLPLTAVRCSGETFPAEASISHIDVAGQMLFTMIIRDITERRLAEAHLAQQTAMLTEQARLLELAYDAIVVHTFEHSTIQYWNSGAELLYGWNKDEALGQSTHALFHTQFPDTLSNIVAELVRKACWEGELTHTTKHGVQRIVASRWALLRHNDGTPRAILEINRDITPQKQAEQALKIALTDEKQARHTAEHAYALLDTLLTNAPIGVAFVDHELRYQRINQSLAAINGLTIAAHLGKPLQELLPDLAPALVPLWRKILATGEPVVDIEVAGTTPAAPGQLRHWLASYYPVRLIDGTMAGIGALVVDITERKQSEQQLQRYADRLQSLHDIDRAILALQTPDVIARTIVARLRSIVGSTTATITLLNPTAGDATIFADASANDTQLMQGIVVPAQSLTIPPALYAGEAYLVSSLTQILAADIVSRLPSSRMLGAYLLTPIIIAGTLRGVLSLSLDTASAFTDEHRLIAREVADQFAIALHNMELFAAVTDSRERLQALSHRLVEVQEAERRAIARELHDEIGQALTAVQMRLQAMARHHQAADLSAALEDSMATVTLALQQVRTLSLDLRPSILDDLGLEPALDWYLARQEQTGGFAAMLHLDIGKDRLPAQLETICYRIVQEAVTNVVRYACASRVDITVVKHDRAVVLRVADDGVGFDVQAALEQATRGRSLGLLGMQERAVLVGGTIAITSRPGCTEIQVVLPLKHPSAYHYE